MTITQLRYFIAVCKYGKIRSAAEHLFVSAPTLSVSLKNLEDELGLTLFNRSNGHLYVTDAGSRLQEYANKVLGEYDNLDSAVKQIKNNLSVIHVGAPSTLCEYPGARLIEKFMTDNPEVLFELSQMTSFEALKAVEEGKIDLAICDGQVVHSDGIEVLPLIESSVSGYVCKDHPLAGATNVTPQRLAQEPLLLLSRRAMPAEDILRWFQNAGVKPNLFMYQYREILSVTFSMVRSHNAAVFLLDALFGNSVPEDIRRFTLDLPLKFKIDIIKKKNRILSDLAEKFYEFCKNICENK